MSSSWDAEGGSEQASTDWRLPGNLFRLHVFLSVYSADMVLESMRQI